MIAAVAVIAGGIAAIELMPLQPKHKKETVYILPRVEDIPTNPNPLQF